MFVGKDVATALGYSNVRDALSSLLCLLLNYFFGFCQLLKNYFFGFCHFSLNYLFG